MKELRKKEGFTQKELGEMLEVSRQTVISIEKSRWDPSLELAFKISKTFDEPLEEIFFEESKPSTSKIV